MPLRRVTRRQPPGPPQHTRDKAHTATSTHPHRRTAPSITAADMARIVIAEFAWENQPECTRQVLAGSACAESSGITWNISSSCPEVRAVGSRLSAAVLSRTHRCGGKQFDGECGRVGVYPDGAAPQRQAHGRVDHEQQLRADPGDQRHRGPQVHPCHETVCRQVIVPEIRGGPTAMGDIFGDD